MFTHLSQRRLLLLFTHVLFGLFQEVRPSLDNRKAEVFTKEVFNLFITHLGLRLL